MTTEKYHEMHDEYVGKHEKKLYTVWRVLGPAGPQEQFDVLGLDEAIQATIGCWDWEVKDKVTGRIIA